jgi:hypothetical protein
MSPRYKSRSQFQKVLAQIASQNMIPQMMAFGQTLRVGHLMIHHGFPGRMASS